MYKVCSYNYLNLQRLAINNRPRLLCMFVSFLYLLPCVVLILSLRRIKVCIITVLNECQVTGAFQRHDEFFLPLIVRLKSFMTGPHRPLGRVQPLLQVRKSTLQHSVLHALPTIQLI